jgi:uncharacterized protein (DUF2141 family)
MKLKTYYWLLAIGSWLLAGACAQIVTPGGGPKDILPPRVEKYIPDSAATNFTAKNIVINFDEFIQLNDLQRELTISPPMNIQPEVKVKGKMLLIEIKDTLKKNTTYTLNFGSAIRDFTENNAKADFQYIFSTGSYIDTIKLRGTVKNAFDQKTDKGVLVMLYESSDDSVPMKKGPSYFARTNADGSYKISNIRPGTYKAFALKETNANYKYDSPDESIAYSDTVIKIYKNTKLDLQLFREEPRKQHMLKKFSKGYGNLMLTYAKPVDKISYGSLKSGTKTETFLTEFNSNRDSILIWFPTFPTDSLCFKVIADETTIDTIRIGTSQFHMGGEGRGEVFKLNMTSNMGKDRTIDLGKELLFYFNHPIKQYKTGHELIKQVYDNMNYSFYLDVKDSIKRTYRIWACMQFDSATGSPKCAVFPYHHYNNYTHIDTGHYSIFIPPGNFTDIFGLMNDTVKLDFKTQEEKFYGTLKLNLKMKYRIAYVLQLINDKGAMYEPVSTDKSIFTYTYLPPGNYTLRIIYDKNGDRKWTPGNYTSHIQPEKVFYYPTPIVIRSNWDSELEWKVE